MALVACLNGQLVPLTDARVSASDAAFLYGAAVVETFRTWQGRLFALERHWHRLRRSLATLGGDCPVAPETLTEWVWQTVTANCAAAPTPSDWRLRVTVSLGSADWQRGWWAAKAPTVVITATPLPADFDARNEQGWRAVIAPWRRDKALPLWQVKTANRLEHWWAHRYARERGAQESLWLNTDGNLTEGATTNVFCVVDGTLWTPPPEEGLLAGVARSVVMDIAAALGLPVREAPLPLPTVLRAEEVFVTNAVVGVVPLTHIEDRPLPQRALGQTLRQRFWQWATGCESG